MSISLSTHAFKKSNTIVCIDGSYVIYYTIFSAVNKWKKESPYSDVLDDIENNIEPVDLLIYPDFVDTLTARFIDNIQHIFSMINTYNDVKCSEILGNVLFVLDPEHGKTSRSWRYMIYPEYKGTRSDNMKSRGYDVYKIFDKLTEVVRENDIIRNRFKMRVISADNVEADDIIATVFTDPNNEKYNKFLIASDKDYLQLKNVTQMRLEGTEVVIPQPYPDLIQVTPEQYLLAKILVGDTSDNITQVFPGVAYKTALKRFISNPEALNESLTNDEVAMAKFKRNTRLIDFAMIPKKIKDRALRALSLNG